MRFFAAQRYDAVDQPCVVQLGIAEFGRACDVGFVDGLAQRAVVRILQHRQPGWGLQCQLPSRALAVRASLKVLISHGSFAGCVFDILWQPCQTRLIVNEQRKGVGCVEQILGKFGAKLGLLFGNRLEARFLGDPQIGTREQKITQLVINYFAPRSGQCSEVRCGF